MNDIERLSLILKGRRKDLDIRNDQCETLRIRQGRSFVGANCDECGWHAKVSLLAGDTVFDTQLLGEIHSSSIEEFAELIIERLDALR